MPLPDPIGRQKEVLWLPFEGHTVVLGTAGSGKTTLAILRAALLSTQFPRDQILLVTFNKMLVTYLKAIAPEELQNVDVRNYHHFARGYLRNRGKMGYNKIAENDVREAIIAELLESEQETNPGGKVLQRAPATLAEEFAWIAKSGITNTEDYVNAERIGRSTLRITRKERPIVYDLYEKYRTHRLNSGYWYDWDDLATAVLTELGQDESRRFYRHVVIDEGQDFSPQMLRSLVAALPPNGSLTFFGDVAQQIYGTRISWRSAGLKPPKIWEFEENYRNTKQIAQLAVAISQMPYYQGTADLVVPRAPKADGPLPSIVRCTDDSDELEVAIRQALTQARTRSVAILLRTRDREDLFLQTLRSKAVSVQRLHRDANSWIAGPSISVGTYAAAKGLEFDSVVLPFCNDNVLPNPDRMAALDHSEDALAEEGRLLYVAITRARSSLILTYSSELTRLLPTSPTLYARGDK